MRTALVLLGLAMAAGVPVERAQLPPTALPAVTIEWNARIPMRDGVRLNATIYRPAGAQEKLPVIVTITPYTADTYHDRAMYFARRGFAFALVDSRGRGNSEGTWEPAPRNAHEPQDGYDVVEWLGTRGWSTGKVGMWGGSFAGTNQWMTAKEFPPHLATIVPAATGDACSITTYNNIFPAVEVQWQSRVNGRTLNANAASDEEHWISIFRALYLARRPFRDLDVVAGLPSPAFQRQLEHPGCDSFWERWGPSAADYRRMTIPVLSITGQFDDMQRGQMRGYAAFMREGSPAAREGSYLVNGPWDHSGTRTPTREVGGLQVGERSMVDLNALHREWYDWTLRGAERPAFLQKHVAYYVTGAEEWRYADSLEAVTRDRRRLYLASGGEGRDRASAGVLSDRPAERSGPDTYVYDPLDLRAAELEREPITQYLIDDRFVRNLAGDGLVYDAPPFGSATELCGMPQFDAWIALDVPDTDFVVTLYEVRPDDSVVLLGEDRMRARYRESLHTAKLVIPGKVERYSFSTFPFMARRLAVGSRLRLVLRSPNSIFWEKNYNSGGVVAAESGKDSRRATVTLFQDREHQSVLEVPICR